MKTWGRAYPNEACGSCGTRQVAGAAVLVIVLPALEQHRRRIRCEACAGEAPRREELAGADADVEDEAAARRARLTANQQALAAALPEPKDDWKQRAAGERQEDRNGSTYQLEAPAADAGPARHGGPHHRAARKTRGRHRRHSRAA
jgi:hypothetical protein